MSVTVVVLCAVATDLQAEAQPFRWVRPGNHLWYYRSALDDTLQPYHIYVPRDFDPTQPHPVVTFLHGFGGRAGVAAPDAWRQNWADAGGWLLVRADGRGSQNWDFIGEDDLFEMLRDLRTTTPFHAALNIDTRRLYLEGGSMGGHGGYREAFRYPDKFAAVAPAAGWTTYREFYEHFYDRAQSPRMPQYVDPARQPVLETASSLWQAPNARHLWVYLIWDTNDTVNPQVNQLEVIKKLQAAGSGRYATRIGDKGHVGSYSANANYHFFADKVTEASPRDVFYTTNDLRYNQSYWLTIDRLNLTRHWGSVDAHIASSGQPQRVVVKTANVLGFTLDLARAPVDQHRPIYIEVDGKGAKSVRGRTKVSFRASLSEDHELTQWYAGGATPTPHRGDVRKRPGLSGPLAEAFRTPFVVLYGTRGGERSDTVDNPDWAAAQHFATEWNAWMILQWRGGTKPPPERRANWWVPPYPFPNGPMIPERQAIVQPVPDWAFDLQTLPRDRNLILFGDPSTNWVIDRIAPELPLELSLAPQEPSIRVGSRLYRGEHVNYFFISPSPLNRERYVVIARGYLSSRVDPSQYGAGNVGKDLEALPFYWPDYVVWDARRNPTPAKQKPFVYLPAAFLDAGYFAEDWQLDTTPPRTKIKIDKIAPDATAPHGAVKVTLSARDAPGGFGVEGIEYRLDRGPWRPYTTPFVVTGRRTSALSVRATDKCGQFVYDHSVSPERGVRASGNVEPPQTIHLVIASEADSEATTP